MSELFFASEGRRDAGLRVKERGRKKHLCTVFGNVELTNDIYEDTRIKQKRAHDAASALFWNISA